MGEHVRQILDALPGLCLHPRCGGPVLAGARGSRDLPVRDVADEDVPERVLALAFHRAPACRAYELPARQLVKRELDLALVEVAHRGQRAAQNTLPTTAASWRSPLRSGESVSSRAAISA